MRSGSLKVGAGSVLAVDNWCVDDTERLEMRLPIQQGVAAVNSEAHVVEAVVGVNASPALVSCLLELDGDGLGEFDDDAVPTLVVVEPDQLSRPEIVPSTSCRLLSVADQQRDVRTSEKLGMPPSIGSLWTRSI